MFVILDFLYAAEVYISCLSISFSLFTQFCSCVATLLQFRSFTPPLLPLFIMVVVSLHTDAITIQQVCYIRPVMFVLLIEQELTKIQ